MSKDYLKHLMAEIHELNVNIIDLTKEISRLKKYIADNRARIIWIQQNLGKKTAQHPP